jgi:hypothetical protein
MRRWLRHYFRLPCLSSPTFVTQYTELGFSDKHTGMMPRLQLHEEASASLASLLLSLQQRSRIPRHFNGPRPRDHETLISAALPAVAAISATHSAIISFTLPKSTVMDKVSFTCHYPGRIVELVKKAIRCPRVCYNSSKVGLMVRNCTAIHYTVSSSASHDDSSRTHRICPAPRDRVYVESQWQM